MNKTIIILLLALTTITANAQNFLDNLRKNNAGQGNVTVVESAAIDSLVNNQHKQNTAQQTTSQPANHQQTTTTPPTTTTETTRPATTGSSDTEEMPTVVDTRKKVMRNSYKTQGYRIQVFSGGNSRNDRQKAETAGAVMKSNFPTEPIYVHFYSPSWKCRMGNYKTVEEARAILAKVKKLGYNQACIVKGTISVQY